MVSDITLCSNALLSLGEEPISSFEEAGSGAKAAANLYENCYLSMLSMHRWRFATKKAELSRLAASPENQYKYQYQLPSDMVFLITTYPVSTYAIYEDKIYTDSSDVQIDYIYRVDESKLPAYFVKAMELYLAREFAIPVTEDINKAEYFHQRYLEEVKKARFADSQSQPQTPIVDAPYINVRVI